MESIKKRGRRKKADKEKLEAIVKFRLTEEDKKSFEEFCVRTNTDMTELLRNFVKQNIYKTC